MTPHATIDVLISGAGPVGSALAIDLTRRGLAVRVLDKSAEGFPGSRAKGIQPRTQEVLHDLGVLDAIHAGGGRYPLLGVHLGPLTIPWRMASRWRPTEDVPYPATWLLPQNRTNHALHEGLRELGGRLEFGRELLDFTQNDDTVTARVAADGGVEEITARYLVGADGGSSTVRKHAGIGFTGSTDEQDRMLIVDAVTTGLSRTRWHMWPRSKGRGVAACPLPNSESFQWMIRLSPDEQPPSGREQLTRRIRAETRNTAITLHDISWTSVFRPNIRLAEAYRRGRVLIAGDAAHVHTPAGAQGLNTGIGDSYNLGWKLAQVLAGADERLLDTYETERRPIAAAVLGLSTEKYHEMRSLNPSSLRRGKDVQQLDLTYHSGPLAPGQSESTKTLHVGDRAPDATLCTADGAPIRLFDLFQGPHFTAIAYGTSAAAELDRLDWPTAGAPLRRLSVDAPATGADRVLTDPEHSFRRIYGLAEDTLLLIRPDSYLGHIATRDMRTSTANAVRTMTPPATNHELPDASQPAPGMSTGE